MKLKKVCAIILMFLFCVCFPYCALANGLSQLQTSKIPDAELTYYKEVYSISRLDKELQNETIKCFDVNNKGDIAIGSKTNDKGYIYIYDSDFNHICSYCFTNAGSYCIEWSKDSNLSVYYIRDDIAATYNAAGEIVNIETIDDTMENSAYLHSLDNTERQIGNDLYKVQNDMGILNVVIGMSSYSQLIKTDDAGNTTVLYDVNTEQTIKTVIILIAAISFTVLSIIIIISAKKKNDRFN
ncbi:MAG: hypothetical protein E7520_06360 [Ruminococcaceae bacterium]|nr:hypothetical protein [Oscillospiraceae bacterium]